MRRALFWLILSFGLGSFLTLLSCFCTTPNGMVFMDEVPIAYNYLRVGYPFPVFVSYAELWSGGHFSAVARFVWIGALFDTILYAFIVFWVILIVQAKVTKAKSFG